MRTRMGLIAATSATIAAAALTAACGQPQAAPGGGTPAGTISTPPTGAAGGCKSGPVQVTNADNGKTLCVTTGSSVDVMLTAPDNPSRWSKVDADSDSLVILRATGAVIPAGTTSAAFTAKHPGTVHLSSSRPTCPAATGTHVRCHSVQGFQVTVTVS